MSEFERALRDLKQGSEQRCNQLSGDEKERILQGTLKKINQKGKRTMWYQKRVAIICVAVIVSFGTVVTADALFNISDAFVRYFKGNVNTPVAGENLVVSTTYKDITISADQVVGDTHGCYILFHLQGQDISLDQFENIDVMIEGSDVVQVSDMIMMGSENEDKSTFLLHVVSDQSIEGKEIHVLFENLGTEIYDEAEQMTVFQEKQAGQWKLSWDIQYESQARQIDVNREVSVYGGTATWDRVSVSPVSATVFLTEKELFAMHTNHPNDTLKVELKDGTIIRSDYAVDTDVLNDTTSISLYFHQVVSFTDIVSITFAGEKLDLHEAVGLGERTTYKNEDVHISIDFPNSLYQIITPILGIAEFDNDLKTNVSSVAFQGEIEGVQAMLFGVRAYKGTFSATDLDEKKPLEQYITTKNDVTYTIYYGFPETEKQIALFADVMNQEVAKIRERIEILD